MLAASNGVTVRRVSPAYDTAPWIGDRPKNQNGDNWEKAETPDYLNAIVEFETSLEPHAVLRLFQDIEQRLGRPFPHGYHSPRTVDLDLILHGDTLVNTETLTIPHRHATARAFVLKPLLEIAPEIADPATGEPWSRAYERLSAEQRDSCRRAAPLVHETDALPTDADLPGGLLVRSLSPDATEAFGRWMADRLEGGETIALVGSLGAGKTCWARGLARGLGIREPITSPSYVLVKSYEGLRLNLHHADFYRLESGDVGNSTSNAPALDPAGFDPAGFDPTGLGLEDYLEDPRAVVLVEWADNFPRWVEPPFHLIEIEGCGDEPRWILHRRIEADNALPDNIGSHNKPSVPERTLPS